MQHLGGGLVYNMALHFNGRYSSVDEIKGPSGFYNIIIGGENVPVYVDQTYDGGGWVCVLANRAYTAGMNNLTFYNAIQTPNYRTGGTNNGTNTVVNATGKLTSLADYNIWIGLKYWRFLSGRVTANKMTVVQFVSSTNGTALSGSHTKRYRWNSDFFGPTFQFVNAAAVGIEAGSGVPGMYSYHAVNGFSFSAYDLDRDTNGGNCATFYNNNPWWYGSCWDGNYFAGGSYADIANWAGTGSDQHQYGAVYIK